MTDNWSYSLPDGSNTAKNASGTFFGDFRSINGKDCTNIDKQNDPSGQEHWGGRLSGQTGMGTNNFATYRDEVFEWFRDF